MYCPNCGVEIHPEGSFCAKCRKNVAYLTHKKPEDPVLPAETELTETADLALEKPIEEAIVAEALENSENLKIPATKNITPIPTDSLTTANKNVGYYCNYCGCFVYPEDHFCYDCGKKTQRSYYQLQTPGKKTGYIAIAAGCFILLCFAAYFFFA